MNNLLDIAFVIGILLNFTKGADLFLLEAQKKKIQISFETFKIYLDRIKPINWFEKLKTKRAQNIILISSIVFICFFLIIGTVFNKFDIHPDRTPKTLGEKINTNPIFIAVTWLISIPLISKLGVRINRWLIKDHKLFKFFLRYLLYTLCMLMVIYSIIFLSLWISSIIAKSEFGDIDIHSNSFTFFAITMLLLFPVALLFYGNFVVYNFIILIAVLQLTLNILLTVIRGLIWRIVEYNKGVYSALVLIVTMVLGIIELKIKNSR